MDLKLTGRSVLITGASKGIGLGIAKWFAGEGVHPRLVARSADLLAKEAEVIRKSAQVNVETLAADLSDPAVRLGSEGLRTRGFHPALSRAHEGTPARRYHQHHRGRRREADLRLYRGLG